MFATSPTLEFGALGHGDRLGDYELLTLVGEGGMGRVWAARPLGASGRARLVAIKTSLLASHHEDEFWKALFDEARIASRVQHPNVCGIRGANTEKGIAYLVMDWSDAGTLHELLEVAEQHRIEPAIAVRIASRLCAGLHAVHELVDDAGEHLNVVHRDVSPQNVLLSTSGQVRLCDFGVAKARGKMQAATRTGEMKGKLSYMAPEQVAGGDVDRRVDVFAVGCVLYEATTGSRPFRGDDALTTLYQLMEREIVAPSRLVADYPAELESIVLKALARSPDQRFQTADEMARALEQFLVKTQTIVGEAEVGAFIRHALTEHLESQQRAIDEAIAELDAVKVSRSSAPAVVPNAPKAEVLPHPRLRYSFFGIASAALVIGSLILAMPSGSTDTGQDRSSPLREANGALPTDYGGADSTDRTRATSTGQSERETGAEPVEITLLAEPAHAVWHIDDGPGLANPHRLEVVPDEQVHQLRAVAEGYDSFRASFAFDRPRELRAELVKKPVLRRSDPHLGSPQPGIAQPGVAQRGTPQAGVAEHATGPATAGQPDAQLGGAVAAGSAAVTTPPTKPVRQLDQDNPYTNSEPGLPAAE